MDTPITSPYISILMCTFNRAHYLPQAIESVLTQDFKDFELIIMDDASTDTTENIIRKYTDTRIRYIQNPHNLGLGKNRVAAFQEAKGALVAILDSDDYWIDPKKLSTQIAFLNSHPDVALVGTFGSIIDETSSAKGFLTYQTMDSGIRKKILSYHQFLHSSVLMRKDAVIEAGGYDETLAPAEDYSLILSIGTKHTLANLPNKMTAYRIHQGNTSSNEKRKKTHHAKLHLALIKKFKKDYSNYFPAIVKAYLRILINYF